MIWATVITGPDGDAPEQRRQPVGWGQGWGGGDWQLSPSAHCGLEEGMETGPRGAGRGGVLDRTLGGKEMAQ